MEIEIGKFYVNKTWKYLLPCMKDHGSTFTAKMSSVFKLAFGIGDSFLENKEITSRKAIYILLDKKSQPAKFRNFMDWIQNQSYYLYDYAFDDVLKGRKHMLILELPPEYHKAYDYFLEGKYSKMYSLEQIDKLFNNYSGADKVGSLRLEAKNTLLKSFSMRKPFIEKLKVSFGNDIDVKESDLTGAELDFPIEKEKEIFNYSKNAAV